MEKQPNNMMRSVLTQLTGNLSDSAFVALASSYNLPAGLTLGIAQALAKGALQGVMLDCYDDFQKRMLSSREVQKHNMVFDIAERTYFNLAAKNYDYNASQELVVDDSYLQSISEVAEHASLEAIRQSEDKKIEVLGRYYGGEFYKHGWNIDFLEMHQMITMVGTLTFRQIVLIRLISEGFKGYNWNLFISNPSACVEVNRLKDYGIWITEGAAFGIDESGSIQLKSIIPSNYSDKVCEALMLDKLSDDDVKRIVDSLNLTTEGTPQTMLTEEDLKQRTTFKVDGEKLILPGGKTYGGDLDEDMFLTDVMRGK